VSINEGFELLFRQILEPAVKHNEFKERSIRPDLPLAARVFQVERRGDLVAVHGKTADDHVFTREDGEPVRDFRGSWAKVCEASRVPDLLFHDLRRTAARNLRRAGVAEGVIMKIGGWKTRSVFERYAIVSQGDIRDAMTSLEAKQQRDNEEAAQQKSAATAENQFGHDCGKTAQTWCI